MDTFENNQISLEIENSYIESIHAQSAAALWLIDKRGPIREIYLLFYGAFLRVYLYTSSTPDVEKRLNDRELKDKIANWFARKSCNTNELSTGIHLHREYINILQNTGTVSSKRRS